MSIAARLDTMIAALPPCETPDLDESDAPVCASHDYLRNRPGPFDDPEVQPD